MANNIDVLDGGGLTRSLKTTESAGVHVTHHNVDSSALPSGAATETTLVTIKVAAANTSTKATAIYTAAANTAAISFGTRAAANTTATQVTSINSKLADAYSGEYETVAASQTDQVLGSTGAVGDYLAGLLVVPANTSPGTVSIKDGNGSGITVFAGGASSVTDLRPFFVQLGMKTINATTPGWKVTTGTSVSVIGVGNFT